jgi:sigma54-dependent transcription regulator
VQIARHLMRVVTIEKQLQRIRVAAQVLSIEQLCQLLPAAALPSPLFERFRLSVKVLECRSAARRSASVQLVQIALGR